jgi:hypothetical protein
VWKAVYRRGCAGQKSAKWNVSVHVFPPASGAVLFRDFSITSGIAKTVGCVM